MARINRLSTHEIMEVSRDTFNKLSSQQHIDISAVGKFFDSARFDLSDEEIKDVQLALVLIASAHKLSEKLFDDAKRLLNLCDFLSSYNGNPVQRVVHYFTKALQEKIARETGRECRESRESKPLCPLDLVTKGVDPAFISCCLRVPCIRISQFAAIQAVLDSLASARKVHFVDLTIRSGIHCPVLMQALANRHEKPVEFLKITAFATPQTKQKTEEIGKCLTCLAETLNLPFLFCVAMIPDIKDLEKEMLNITDDEVVAVFSLNVLRHTTSVPDFLKSFSRFLRNLNPCVLAVVESEELGNSLVFIDHFHESLISYGSFYDCIQACIDQGDPNRAVLEVMVGHQIRCTVAAKDEERIYSRQMNIEEWRDYFSGFGMVETEVSMSSFDQATLLQKNFASEKSCLLVRNGKCLVIGWKGTPFFSVSAWKFQ
ncbi:DELLA protein RGL2-like [Euphorbia lathyris]|uniref:DELLA protein RGL2-like n=1 Tax=Euphorbia lathyris TaxID=212925 RepID=UPI00331432F7